VPISKLNKKRPCERPLILETKSALHIAVLEAGLLDYARMRLLPAENIPNTIVSSLGSDVEIKTVKETYPVFIKKEFTRHLQIVKVYCRKGNARKNEKEWLEYVKSDQKN